MTPSATPHNPAQRLDALSANFKPDNCHFSLDLNTDPDLARCQTAAADMLQRLQTFIANGDSAHGTQLPYTSVTSVKRYSAS